MGPALGRGKAGKAPDSGSGDRGFESYRPSQCHVSRHRHHYEPPIQAGFRGGGPGGLPVGWYDLEVSRVRARRSSPVAAWTTRTSRSWTSMMTGVRAWVRPTPIWKRWPSWRRVTLPSESMTSWRARWWWSRSRLAVGAALGREW